MLVIKHTTPTRLLSHLRRLERDGNALLALRRRVRVLDETPWDVRVWRCLDKIADRHAFDSAMESDLAEVWDPLSFQPKSAQEIDTVLRRRIGRRLVTLASVVEKVEAYAELETSR